MVGIEYDDGEGASSISDSSEAVEVILAVMTWSMAAAASDCHHRKGIGCIKGWCSHSLILILMKVSSSYYHQAYDNMSIMLNACTS